MTVADCVGQRALMTDMRAPAFGNRGFDEWFVEELAPSRRYAKLMDKNGKRHWVDVDRFAIIEVLAPKRKRPDDAP